MPDPTAHAVYVVAAHHTKLWEAHSMLLPLSSDQIRLGLLPSKAGRSSCLPAYFRWTC